MDTQLTININNSSIIKGAKLYAKENQISLSELVENYLSSLIKSYYTMEKSNEIPEGYMTIEEFRETSKISLTKILNEHGIYQ